MLEDRRARPARPKAWYQRYAGALFLAGMLLAVLGLVITTAFLADETAKAYSGDFDEASWQEPRLAAALGLDAGALDLPPAHEVVRPAAGGDVAWSVAPDGTVVMRPVAAPVPWPEAKAAFEAWAGERGVPAPTYKGIVVVADGEPIPRHLLA